MFERVWALPLRLADPALCGVGEKTENEGVTMKNLIVNDRGIFEQEAPRLVPISTLSKRRRQLERRILWLRGAIQDAEIGIAEKRKELAEAEEQRKFMDGPVIQGYIAKEKQRLAEIQAKSQAVLKECIGDELYARLQEQKRIIFTANDNLTYKIESNGRVYRKVEKEWKLLCIIRPQNLPLPDFLLAMFVNLRQNPSKYPLRRR